MLGDSMRYATLLKLLQLLPCIAVRLAVSRVFRVLRMIKSNGWLGLTRMCVMNIVAMLAGLLSIASAR